MAGVITQSSEAALDRQLDGPSLQPVQWRVLLLVFGTLMLEGVDLQVLGLAAPSMAGEWGLSSRALGPAMAAALIGMAIGSPLGGRFGDRLGRRPLLIGCTLFFGILTALTAAASSIGQIGLLRLAAGLGFGAALSNAPTLIAEWMPERRRNQVTALALIGVPFGGMVGAAVASWLIPAFGWRSAFIFGGATPIVLAALMLNMLPESPSFLQALDSPRAGDSPFQPPYARSTLGLALAFFASLTVSYAFFNWTPTLLSGLGMSVRTAIRGVLVFNLMGMAGALLCPVLMSRLGSRRALFWLMALGILSAGGLAAGLHASSASLAAVSAILLGVGLIGVAGVGGQVGLFGLGIHAYPTTCRATGLGIAGCTGRFGGILSAFAGGAVLSLAHGSVLFMLLIALLFLLCALGVAIVDRHAAAQARQPLP